MQNEKAILLNRGGAFGDLIVASTLLPALKTQGYYTMFACNAHYASILKNNPYLDELIALEHFTAENIQDALKSHPTPERHILLPYPPPHPSDNPYEYYQSYRGPIQMHLAHYFCHLTGVPFAQDYYVPVTDELLSRYAHLSETVLIQPRTSFSPYKNWQDEKWRTLASGIEKYLGYNVMQLSTPGQEIAGIDVVETPDIIAALAALKACKLFIGLDSVFNHATQAFYKPSIILWGSTNPTAFGYAQNINLVNGVRWHPEQGNEGAFLKCQPCYLDTKHVSVGIECQHQVHLSGEQTVQACMASTTAETVYYWVKQLLLGDVENSSRGGLRKSEEDLIISK